MKNLFSNIKGDLFGGITAGIVALPLALAFGVSSGLGPSAGLYGAIFIAFFASLFGGTDTQISGPTAPMTAVSIVVIAAIIATNDGNLQQALPIILSVFLLAGLMQIGLGALGFGKYIKYIPYPVVSGFMTAIGVIILITQILPSIGYYAKDDVSFVNQFKPQANEIILQNILKDEAGKDVLAIEDFQNTIQRADEINEKNILKESKTLAGKESSGVLGTLKVLPQAIKKINFLEFLLALGTILIIFGFKRITKSIPSTLVALVVMTSIALIFDLKYIPIQEIPGGFPTPNLEIFTTFNFSTVTPYIFTAFTLALLGAIDSLLTSVIADNMTKTKHLPNKELVGQGIGNTVAAIFGGIPGAGATIRTVVNINSGGKTKLSGMVAALMLLIILLGLGPIASKIPAAVLAGVLITVGIGVMDYKGLKAIPNLPKDVKIGPIRLSSEVIIMFTVMILSIFWDLVYAVGLGLIIASLIFMKKIGDVTSKESDIIPLEEAWDDETEFPESLINDVFIKHINGPLFFGFTSNFQALSKQIPETAEMVIIRMDKMRYIDQSGLFALEDILIDLKKNGKQILFVGVLEQPQYMMERIGIIPDLIPNNHIFETFSECLEWVKNNISKQHKL
ncbi:SulP family sulfate permease [Tenacibaculum skagerrakense]|uniref:SulP family sulfate permease n=1 Tax=Tenacibaculum skagerrakense TaxID=186571 RepID=A0A4R2P114_9FLAO|nr:SulP family inorganic anion transporter [Tenacibaculum skagerrakense]TCP28320.1 SulP family sulfate permease [Tenacibaculum skagerrakense]